MSIFRKKYKNIFIIILVVLTAKVNVSFAQKYSEYDLKGVYLYNFTNFVTWPKETYIIWPGNQPTINFYIGVYGDNPFGKVLEIIAQKKSRPNFKWHINYYTSPEQIDTCNLLFFSYVKKAELIKVLNTLKGRRILTVGDEIPNFCELGGIINFTKEGNIKPFQINNQAATIEGLIISPKLLKLAKLIEAVNDP